MLSIIIPTLNEEKRLGRLLQNIKEQTWTDYEVIVSDAASSDRTVAIARENGCRVFVESDKTRRHPSIQRNNGATLAQGDWLLFLDADSVLPDKSFLENTINEAVSRSLALAGFYIDFRSKRFFYKFYRELYNWSAYLAQYFKPLALGAGILIKKDLHYKIGGFDEGLYIGEDQFYCEQAAKLGRFRMIKKVRLLFSIRRFERDGRWRVLIRILYSVLYVLIRGPIKKKIVPYDFGRF